MEHEDLTEKILECAFEVIKELGAGFLEGVYENALAIALNDKGLMARTQVPLSVSFRNTIVGNYFADMIVEEKILVELKAVKVLLPEHQAQVINYLKVSSLSVGLLINFGNQKLEFKRLFS